MASETSPDENVRSMKRKTVYAMAGTRFITSDRMFPGSVTSFELRKPGMPAKNSSSSLSSSNELSVQDRPRTSISGESLKAISSVSLVNPRENRLLCRCSMTEILYQPSKLTSLRPCNFEATVLRMRTMIQQIPVAQNQATCVSGVKYGLSWQNIGNMVIHRYRPMQRPMHKSPVEKTV